MTQVAKRTKRELATLHGMGPKALRVLGAGLAAHGMQFRRD
jgi:hypothetical protein